MVKLALIGCGLWGKNYLSNLRDMADVELLYVCDIKNEPPGRILPKEAKFSRNHNEVLDDKEVKGVIIATPTSTHYEMVRSALLKGKNVLVEKPITTNSEEAKALFELAKEKGLILMVGHIFKFNPAVRYIKEMIDKGEIGDLRYIEARRVGLGPIRTDVDVLWDLATHDIYISKYLTGKKPLSLSSFGVSHNKKLDDVSCTNIKFPGDVLATIYVNWEHPVKERKIFIGGTKKAILFDDVEPTDKIKIYDKGVDYQPASGEFSEFIASTRDGDIIIPKIKSKQPLTEEIRHFIDCIEGKTACESDGQDGFETVKILESADISKKSGGKEIEIKW